MNVSAIPGRLGMDAVREFLQSRGGDVDVVLDPGDDEAEYRTFVTRIRIPAAYTLVIPRFEAGPRRPE